MEERLTGVPKISGPCGGTHNLSSEQLLKSQPEVAEFPTSLALERGWVLKLQTSGREKATSARAT